ncbi:hypothetical protein Tco_0270390 [Tanacetum coccineum]
MTELEAVYSGLGITHRGGDEVPSFGRYPVLRLCHRTMAHSITGRSQAPEKVTVTDLFYLRGQDVRSVNIPYLLTRYLRRFAAGRKSGAHISGGQLQICVQLDDTWAWVAMGPERQPDASAGALGRMARLEEDVHEIRGVLTEQREVIDAMARNFSRFSKWVTTGLGRMMDRVGVTYISYAQTHVSYQRHVRQKTGKASTSAAQQDP